MNKDYLVYFDFRDEPFKLTPDVNYYFFSNNHEFIFQHLMYFVESDEPFAVVVGEPGTGKTITIRKFIDEIKNESEVAYILFPSLKPVELFIAILEDLKIKIPTGVTKNKLFSLFRDYLIKKNEEGKKVIVIVDEAQNLPIETLEELRILSNLETENEKLIKILLAGQPELIEKISLPELRQLRQRITIIQEVKPLNSKEVEKYVFYRIAKADGKVDIDDNVFEILYEVTKGYPRLINQVMDRALMAAYIDKVKKINKDHIKRAAESLNLIPRTKESKIKTFFYYTFAFTLLIFLLAVSVFLFKNYFLTSKHELNSSRIEKTRNSDLAPNKTIEEKKTRNIVDTSKKYILYLYTTVNINDAFDKKIQLEKVLGKKLVVIKLRNSKYYAVAILYKNKENALKDLPKLKEITGYKDAFITPVKYNPEIITSSNSIN